MGEALKLPKFSVGVGDRFAHQAKAQLAACVKAGAGWSGSGAGVEQVEPRAHDYWHGPEPDAQGGGCGGEGAGLGRSLIFWMRTTST